MIKDCQKCKNTLEKLQKDTILENPICLNCNECYQCAKKDGICKTCTHSCTRCSKIMIQDNWPIDIIKDGKCDKCYHLCTDCGKYVKDGEEVYHSSRGKKRYCDNCYILRFLPKDGDFKYNLKTIKEKNRNTFARWAKTYKNICCETCEKNFWQPINKKGNKCLKCAKGKKVKKEEPVNNPSNKNNHYEMIDNKWTKVRERQLCKRCLTSLWIDIENITKELYHCPRCRPTDDKKKYKYNKDKQQWIVYREQVNCKTCDKDKWIFTKDKTNGHCKQCSLKSIKKDKVTS